MLATDEIASSALEPVATKNGEGLPEVVRRATEGPNATSNSGLTVTVGERGPKEMLAPSAEVQDAATPVIVSEEIGK